MLHLRRRCRRNRIFVERHDRFAESELNAVLLPVRRVQEHVPNPIYVIGMHVHDLRAKALTDVKRQRGRQQRNRWPATRPKA